MKNLKALNGNVFIKLKHTMNDRTESGLYKDITFDVHGKMMIYAECIAVSEEGSDEVMLQIDVGVPKPKEADGSLTVSNYVRNYEVKHDIRVGDRVYFHYLTLEDKHNFISYEHGYYTFKVPIQDVFLSVRPDLYGDYVNEGEKKKVHLHNQYALGKEYWGVGWEEVEIEDPISGVVTKIAGKTNSFGMVTETKDKPLEDMCIITDIGRGIKPYSRNKEVKKGDAVMLHTNCEFRNEIERQERWVFTHQDILAVIEDDGTIRPVSDMVLIKLREREYDGDLIVDVRKLPLNEDGEIVSVGRSVDDEFLSAGTEVKFASHGARVIDDTHVLVHDCNIMGILKFAI